MNVNWDYIRSNIETFPEYRSAIFEQGFLLTNYAVKLGPAFPFYDFWREVDLAGKAHLYVHQNQKAYVHQDDGNVYLLLGHAYDPFDEEWDEQAILKTIAGVSGGDFQRAIPKINDLTGLFLFGMFSGESLTLCGDFESMRAAYYGKADGHWYVASHEEIVAQLAPLTRDDYVEKLENYRWYHLYGEGLPGDITHYHELKKIICNNYVVLQDGTFSSHRFYPVHPLDMCKDEEDYQKTVDEIARVMKVSLNLIAKKWPRTAVSVTGGRDSKGSLAAAAHLGDSIQYYSYNSQHAEKVDCDAAKRICDSVGVKHTTYDIPLDRDLYPEYDLAKAILCMNSNRKYFNHNDIMKRIYFRRLHPFDVEVKSWTSEIGRAFYADKERKLAVQIGSDVWIGRGALLIAGITIGDGAVIGAGAVVTKDVPPFTIMGGNPAKPIRKRFTDQEIEFLLHDAWWEKDLQWLQDHADLFKSIETYQQTMESQENHR